MAAKAKAEKKPAAAKKKKVQPTGKRKEALDRVEKIENAFATTQAMVGSLLRETRELRALIEGEDKPA